MKVQFYQTEWQDQVLVSEVTYENGEVTIEGSFEPELVLEMVFGDTVPSDPETIMGALLDCPRRFDGMYLRASVVMQEGGPGSGWFSPPKGTHGIGSQGGPQISKKQLPMPGIKPGPGVYGVEPEADPSPESRPPPPPPSPKAPSGPKDIYFDYVYPGDSSEREDWRAEALEWQEEGVDEKAGEREWIAVSACDEYDTPLYGMYDGDELVGLLSMQEYRENGSDIGADPEEDYQYIEWLATKYPGRGYGRDLLEYGRQVAGENDNGVYLTATVGAMGFYYHMGGNRRGGSGWYWNDWYEEKEFTDAEILAAEILAGGAFAWSNDHGKGDGVMPEERVVEGGQGSGWWAPPRGTHGIGSQGGPTDRTIFEQTVEAGEITSTSDLGAGITVPQYIEWSNDIEGKFKEHGAYGTLHDGFSEVAAYEVAQLLNPVEQVVPEALNYEHEGMEGTVHEWVDGTSAGTTDYTTLRAALDDPENLSRLETILALDVIAKNTDQHEGNWMIDEEGKVWAIDYGHAGWAKREDFGHITVYRSPVWSMSHDNPNLHYRNQHGAQTRTYRFREWTLQRWEKITYDEFAAAIQPQIDRSYSLSGVRGPGGDYYQQTRVSVDSAWANFQLMLSYGEVQQSY